MSTQTNKKTSPNGEKARYRQLIRNLRLIKEGKRKFLILEVQDELKTQTSKQ